MTDTIRIPGTQNPETFENQTGLCPKFKWSCDKADVQFSNGIGKGIHSRTYFETSLKFRSSFQVMNRKPDHCGFNIEKFNFVMLS